MARSGNRARAAAILREWPHGHEGEIIMATFKKAANFKVPKNLSPNSTQAIKAGFPRTRGSVIVYDTMLSP